MAFAPAIHVKGPKYSSVLSKLLKPSIFILIIMLKCSKMGMLLHRACVGGIAPMFVTRFAAEAKVKRLAVKSPSTKIFYFTPSNKSDHVTLPPVQTPFPRAAPKEQHAKHHEHKRVLVAVPKFAVAQPKRDAQHGKDGR